MGSCCGVSALNIGEFLFVWPWIWVHNNTCGKPPPEQTAEGAAASAPIEFGAPAAAAASPTQLQAMTVVNPASTFVDQQPRLPGVPEGEDDDGLPAPEGEKI